MNGHVGHGHGHGGDGDHSPDRESRRIRAVARRLARDLRETQNKFRVYTDTTFNFNGEIWIVAMITVLLLYISTLLFFWFQLRS